MDKVMLTKEEIYEALCERHTKVLQDKLQDARVAIAGLGGLGSTIAIALARAGVGHLHLIDFDKVDISNLNRQQYRIMDIGLNKTDCLKEQIALINPYLDVTTDTLRVTPENIKNLFENDTIICEAFDKPEAKSMLVDGFFTYCSSDKVLVSGSGMAGYESSNLITTKKLNKRFYITGDMENGLEKGMSLMAPRVGICACHEANMIIRLIAGETEA